MFEKEDDEPNNLVEKQDSINIKVILESRSENGCLEVIEKKLDDEPNIATNWVTIVYLTWKH